MMIARCGLKVTVKRRVSKVEQKLLRGNAVSLTSILNRGQHSRLLIVTFFVH